jgi:hypothetical protein
LKIPVQQLAKRDAGGRIDVFQLVNGDLLVLGGGEIQVER